MKADNDTLARHAHRGDVISRRSLLKVLAGTALAPFSLTMTGCSTITTDEEESLDQVGQIIPSRLAIVHTGCVNGAFEKSSQSLGIASVTHIAKTLEEEGFDVFLFDSGDSLTGSELVDLSYGETAIGFLNATSYDALVPGARELSLGSSLLTKRDAQADSVLLATSLTTTADSSPIGTASSIFTLSDGKTVGVIGLTGPQEAQRATMRAAKEFTLPESDTLLLSAQKEVQALLTQGCALVICLANLPGGEGVLTAQEVAQKVPGIDVLLNVAAEASKNETLTDDEGNTTLVVETAPNLTEASVITWDHDSLAVQTYAADYEQTDEQVNALVSQSSQEQKRWLVDELVFTGKSVPLTDTASKETPLGDLVADAARWECRHVGARVAPDAAIVDAGSIKAGLPVGAVTRRSALAVCPHMDTRLYLVQLSGQDLLALLTKAFSSIPTESDDFPQVADLTVTITKTEQEGAPAVNIATVGSQTFSPEGTYAIVVTEHIASGVGAYASLAEHDATSLNTSAGMGLVNYIARECKSGIPSAYDKPQGRIKIVETKQEATPEKA